MIKNKSKIEQLIESKNIEENEFKDFYKNNCAKATQIKFNLNHEQVLSLLYYYNIPRHTREEASKLHSKYLKEKGPRVLKRIDKDCFIKYFKSHSVVETCKQFNIADSTVKKIASICGVEKSHDEILLSKHDGTVRTCLKRYNTTNGGCSPDALRKIREKNKEKYGNEIYFKTDNFKQKSNTTKLKHYGRTDVGQFGSEEHKKAMLEKYGVEYPMLSEELKKKFDDNMIKKYGVNRYAKTLEFHKKARKKYCYNNETFDSSWELALYIYAIDHGETIIRCPCKICYTYKGKEHYYIPDFLYQEHLIEIKGDN